MTRSHWAGRKLAVTLVMTGALSGLSPSRIGAQGRADLARPSEPAVNEQNAQRTRDEVREILDRYPPSVREVLRLDPSLLTKPDYIGLYPLLAAFLAQHPEVAHNPGFFIGTANGPQFDGGRARVGGPARDILIGSEVAAFFITALFVVAWIARAAMEHQRWIRAMKVQTDAHAKLVDRLATNEDLLAYVQSPAGQRFLTAATVAPVTIDSAPRAIAAPIGRILWSIQTGVVVALAGAGLWAAKNQVIEEAAQVLMVFSLLLMAVGVGFVVSAAASYALSRHLGLFDQVAPSPRV
jgi:hypothetical protein